MVDTMVLKTQQWLNAIYGGKAGFGKVVENGQTGWDTINGLIRGLQVELGITALANNFGPSTQAKFSARWPQGIAEQQPGDNTQHNVYAIIQGALWCKGYASVYGGLTCRFGPELASAIQDLKSDMGFGDGSTVDLELMKALLSMKQFMLLSSYGGTTAVRAAQQQINKTYRNYTGIIPTDGLYGREMNTALIQVLQALEGFTPNEATGNFGNGTRARLKTISAANASANRSWMWLASTALVCNGYGSGPSQVWTSTIGNNVTSFQRRYAIRVTGVIDPTTWMSLITSKGDPNRDSVACDTRFEITDEFLARLKADGFSIVGRYLTEPGQDQLVPSDYFKAIRPGELQRIVKGGMKFFPIFQEYSTKLEHFTPANGRAHARAAVAAAERLNIPQTYIYFAVDFDATDPQIESNILPYFKAIKSSNMDGYRIGIYASRNICKRVVDAGCAEAMFVSDMSTGFSGNLGFPIPEGWAFDQFTEIDGYEGKWDLDKVAYSGRIPAVSTLIAPSEGIDTTGTDYQHMSVFSLIWHLEKRFDELRATTSIGTDAVIQPNGPTLTVRASTHKCILNYLAKAYLRDGSEKSAIAWSVAAEPYRSADAKILEADGTANRIIAALEPYLTVDPKLGDRREFSDRSGGRIDMAHLAATCLGYMFPGPVADKWTGWAGDLATGIKNIRLVGQLNPKENIDAIANALIGAGDDWNAKELLASLNLKGVGNECNFSDMCCDGDAIYLASKLNVNSNNTHWLSNTLSDYYNDLSLLRGRFVRIAQNEGANSKSQAEQIFYREITNDDGGSLLSEWCRKLLHGGDNDQYLRAGVRALARFIY